MAGDWLKMDSSTPDKPEVLAITARMGWDDPDLTVGKLFRVWRWFDQQTVDGNAPGVTSALLDRIAGVTGFADAMSIVGWLVVDEAGLSLPKFDRHNGATAKARAQTAKRVASHRGNAEANAVGNGASVTEALAREEKRRVNTPKAPKGAPDGFEAFWTAYPNKVGKGAAVKAFAKISPGQDLLRDMLAALADQKCSVRWLKDGGQYVPNPATWLNQQRWLDEGAGAGEAGGGLQLAGAL